MKQWLLRVLIILFYCVPYVFLSMNGDAAMGTMWFYALMLVAYSVLCFISVKMRNYVLVAMGNVLSLVSSLFCRNLFRTEKWDWFFKPFTDVELMVAISVIAFIVQSIVFFCKKRKWA